MPLGETNPYAEPVGAEPAPWRPLTEVIAPASAFSAPVYLRGRAQKPKPDDESLPRAGLFIGIVAAVARPAPVRFIGRVTGQVELIRRLKDRWALSNEDLRVLLDFNSTEEVIRLFDGITTLRGRDREDRVKHLYRVYEALRPLFRDEAVERQWLRAPNWRLQGEAPLSRMLSGSMEDLLIVRDLAKYETGR